MRRQRQHLHKSPRIPRTDANLSNPAKPRVHCAPHVITNAPTPRAARLLAHRADVSHILHNLFGAPEDVARQHTLTRAAHKLMSRWLGAGEAMLRRLLLIEAAAYPKAKERQRTSRPRTRQLMSFSADEPETWRVSFRCATPTYRRLPAGSSANPSSTHAACRLEAGGTCRFASAWPLAERYEALLRAYNNPAPYARRLAAQLYAKPQRATRLLQASPQAAALIGAYDYAALGENAERANSSFNNSS